MFHCITRLRCTKPFCIVPASYMNGRGCPICILHWQWLDSSQRPAGRHIQRQIRIDNNEILGYQWILQCVKFHSGVAYASLRCKSPGVTDCIAHAGKSLGLGSYLEYTMWHGSSPLKRRTPKTTFNKNAKLYRVSNFGWISGSQKG